MGHGPSFCATRRSPIRKTCPVFVVRCGRSISETRRRHPPICPPRPSREVPKPGVSARKRRAACVTEAQPGLRLLRPLCRRARPGAGGWTAVCSTPPIGTARSSSSSEAARIRWAGWRRLPGVRARISCIGCVTSDAATPPARPGISAVATTPIHARHHGQVLGRWRKRAPIPIAIDLSCGLSPAGLASRCVPSQNDRRSIRLKGRKRRLVVHETLGRS